MADILVEEKELARLTSTLRERAEKGLKTDSDDANDDGQPAAVVVKSKSSKTRARHEFSAEDAGGDDGESKDGEGENIDWRRKPTTAKSAILHAVVKERPKDDALLTEMQDLNDGLLIMAALEGNLKGKRPPKAENFREFEAFAAFQKMCRAVLRERFKGLSSTGVATGDEFVPTNFSNQLIERWRIELMVPGLFQRITMPSNPFIMPFQGADAVAFLVAENTSDNMVDNSTHFPASTPGTGSLSFTAKKLATRLVFSEEMNEDSIIATVPFVRDAAAQAMANADEDADINGDTNGAGHMDLDVTAATDRRKAWNGLRKLTNASAKIDFGNADIDWLSKLRAMELSMGKFASRPGSQLMWIMSPKIYIKTKQNIPELQTLDKYGGQAIILTGEIGRLDGIPIIQSEFMRDDLNATGTFDNITKDRGIILLVNHRQFLHGDRTLMTVNSYFNQLSDQQYVIAKHRLDFIPKIPTGDLANNNIVSLGFNVRTT